MSDEQRRAREVDAFMRDVLKLRTPDEVEEIRAHCAAVWLTTDADEVLVTLPDGAWPNRFRFNGAEFFGHLSADSGEVLLDSTAHDFRLLG
jgi:hypothetical protein